MAAVTRRRNYVLAKWMVEESTSAGRQTLPRLPIGVHGQLQCPMQVHCAVYPRKCVSISSVSTGEILYESGPSSPPRSIRRCNRLRTARLRGLRDYDKRHGWRRRTRTVATEKTVETYRDERWKSAIHVDDVVPAVVEVFGKPAPNNAARLVIGPYHADLTRDAFAWTRRANAADIVAAGDIIDISASRRSMRTITRHGAARADADRRSGSGDSRQPHRSGEGDGGRLGPAQQVQSRIQAYRQLGSTFQPLVYTAAIDRGHTPASIIIDSPVAYPSGSGQVYSPQNYDHTFLGPITLRYALEESRNIPAIKMMDEVGPKNVLAYAKRFASKRPPAVPADRTGKAGDATLMEITSAYTTFPQSGHSHAPVVDRTVKDRDGNPAREQSARADRRDRGRLRLRDDPTSCRAS